MAGAFRAGRMALELGSSVKTEPAFEESERFARDVIRPYRDRRV
jgi:hypothetical protein